LADVEAEVLEAPPNEFGWVDYDWNFACDDVACALKLSGTTAADRLAVATALESRFPTTPQAAELDAAIDAHAATFTDDDRTLNQKRVDALYDLVVNRPVTETVPGGRSAAVVQVTACVFPSCQMPAHRCDLDHIRPFNHQDPEAGGPTVPDNLMPLCRRHHLLKHRTRWHVERDARTGEVRWTAPTGHTYTNPPHTPTT
ncbi:HNH endonuclease signature motif containing protein, partial [Streptomyces albus]|uniref:HNH endonuclease signature motif containing protein n=1 Tax=Streptomyces albus TaxID=1888 RepID=UPI0004CC80D8